MTQPVAERTLAGPPACLDCRLRDRRIADLQSRLEVAAAMLRNEQDENAKVIAAIREAHREIGHALPAVESDDD